MQNTPHATAPGNGIKLVLAWGFVGIPLVWASFRPWSTPSKHFSKLRVPHL